MHNSALRLESFDFPPVSFPPAPIFSQADLDRAYLRGVSEGEMAARSAEADAVRNALAAFERSIATARDDRAAQRREAVATLSPMLEALIAGALPSLARARMQAAVITELQRLSENIQPLTGILRCDPELAPFLDACLQQGGFQDIQLDPSGAPGRIDAEIAGGQLVFDKHAVARSLESLICEIIDGA